MILRPERESSHRSTSIRFLDLLRQLSDRFLRTSPDGLEDSMNHGLEAVREVLGLSRASLHLFAEFKGLPSRLPSGHPRGGGFEELEDLPPAIVERLRSGEPVRFGDRQCLLPLVRQSRLLGIVALEAEHPDRFSESLRIHLRALPVLFTCAVSRHVALVEVEEVARQVGELKARLERTNSHLRLRYERRIETHDIVAESPLMKNVLRLVDTVAPTDSVVLIQGETGTGKEVLARRIHALSRRRNRPMVKVNCAALSPSLIESELFGREKGAYTGALTRQAGRFEAADRATLFLDEVGELPLDLQAKLLRVLQEGRFERLGSTRTIEVDVRVIAATNRDLVSAVEAGDFRRDLFYRLNVFPIAIPPLRERRDDIPRMAWKFAEEFGERTGRTIERISHPTVMRLQAHDWPGNVRELRNAIERAMILMEGPELVVEPSSEPLRVCDVERTLADVQRDHILKTMSRTGWKIRGSRGAADLLGMKPTTLESKMARLGIRRPATRAT